MVTGYKRLVYIYSLPLPPPPSPYRISLMISVDVKHHVYLLFLGLAWKCGVQGTHVVHRLARFIFASTSSRGSLLQHRDNGTCNAGSSVIYMALLSA